MHSMKAAMQHTMGTKSSDSKSSASSSSKSRDGSAHPHGGSDAQVMTTNKQTNGVVSKKLNWLDHYLPQPVAIRYRNRK